ncbi:heme ABC transporter ATP-binding protein [Paenibacillus methanolicus]|uniref:Iron complex transport system ATP-binding protein n=1 Tax=Paenibacillus methanolicus TaxID=582686 RepID=A0A5S5CGU7_9BACL|nr:heme ABC transporter ATP-binding protein [Paenibacillus methanolicus]TYP77560.1 iron complex transport system ATP-binding protein [Paenibacillus methanolicus]
MIEGKALSLSLDGKRVLSDVSFRFHAGGMYGIIGPNGAGKSTLLSLIAGTARADAGQLALDGKPAGEWTRKALARHVAVLQQGGLSPVGFTVKEVVGMGRFPYQNWMGEENADPAPLIARILELTGLSGLADRQIDRLSGGERQRVALAKVMVQEPRLLLLDEPTTYLDIGYQLQLLDTVKQWQREQGITVVAVLHDLNLAAQYCDQLFVLCNGRIEASGTPEAVVNAELVERVYGASSVVVRHPVSGVPQLLLHSRAGE